MSASDLWSYSGRHAVVTGAASGMALATVGLLQELGAKITALDLVEPSVEVDQFVPVDLGRRESIERAAEAVEGPVDALFNIAGVPPTRDPVEVFTINLAGPRCLTEAFLPRMPSGSAVVNVATVLTGLDAAVGAADEVLAAEHFDTMVAWADHHRDVLGDGYMFSKHCVWRYTVVRAPQLIGRGVRMNVVGPATTDTPFVERLHAAMPGIGDMTITDIGRRSTAEEQAVLLVFLNSALPTYLTGAAIANDGGFAAAITTGQFSPPGSKGPAT